jgi:hypothetical protein
MIEISVKSNVDQVLKGIRRLQRDQIPFATAKALTATAKKVQAAIPAMLEQYLDKPTPFTQRGTFVKAARKDDLRAIVGFRPIQSRYLRYQIEGGVRQPAKRALRLPSEQPLNEYGNLPARTIATLVQRARAGRRLTNKQSKRLGVSRALDLFYGDPGDGRPAGIYKRVPLPGNGGNRLIPLIVFPEQAARYERRVPFYREAEAMVRRTFSAELAKAYREAIASAR